MSATSVVAGVSHVAPPRFHVPIRQVPDDRSRRRDDHPVSRFVVVPVVGPRRRFVPVGDSPSAFVCVDFRDVVVLVEVEGERGSDAPVFEGRFGRSIVDRVHVTPRGSSAVGYQTASAR